MESGHMKVCDGGTMNGYWIPSGMWCHAIWQKLSIFWWDSAAVIYHKHEVTGFYKKNWWICLPVMWHHNSEDGILYSHCPEGDSLHCQLTVKYNHSHTPTNTNNLCMSVIEATMHGTNNIKLCIITALSRKSYLGADTERPSGFLFFFSFCKTNYL